MKEKYKTIIIDDEPYAIEVLKILLEKNCKQIEVVATADESIEGVSLINHLNPDIVFLDIEMPRMNGFQLLDEVHNLHFHLIFTTAYDQYAVKAFRYSALDYLLKPIVAKELIEAVNKLSEKSYIDKEHLKLTEKNLHVVQTHTIPERIILPHAKGYTFLKIDDVIYCEAMSSYTKIIIEGKSSMVISKGLGDIEELLKEASFFRAHRQYLVNLKKIHELSREDGGCLLMTNGVKIPLARNRKEEFFSVVGRV